MKKHYRIPPDCYSSGGYHHGTSFCHPYSRLHTCHRIPVNVRYRQKPVNKWTTSSDDSTTRHSFPHTNGSTYLSTMLFSPFSIESHPLYLKSTVCYRPLAVADHFLFHLPKHIPQREPYRKLSAENLIGPSTRTGIPV